MVCRATGTGFTNGSTTSIPSDGVRTLYLCNEDNAGRQRSFSGLYRFDTVGPTFGVIDPVNTVWNTSDTVAVSTNDATSGVTSSEYAISSDIICNSSDVYSPGTSTGASITVNTTDTSFVCFRATDIAGNISYSAALGSLQVDATIPTVGTVTFLDLTQTGVTVGESSSADIHSGLASNWSSFRINAGAPSLFISGTGGTLFTGLLPNTSHTFEVQTRDLVGNTSAWSSPVFRFTLANIPGSPTVVNYSTRAFFVTIAPNSNPTTTQYAIALSRDNWVTTQYVESGSLLGVV